MPHRSGSRRYAHDPNTENSRYEVRRKLGEGGQASVYLVRLRGTDKLYAQKRIADHGSKATEHHILEDVLPGRHRRLANLNASFRHPGMHHLYFDYCDVGDLDMVINRYRKHNTKFPEPFIWHVVKQLAEALAFIHFGYDSSLADLPATWRRVVHRDLKPENVLLTFDGQRSGWPKVVLADFGIAGVPDERGFKSEYPWGTPAWQPPERPIAGIRGDVWALGGCLNAMATEGNPPLTPMPTDWANTHENMREWQSRKEARQPWTISPAYSDTLDVWLKEICDKNYKKRPDSYTLVTAITPTATRERERNVFKQPDWAWINT